MNDVQPPYSADEPPKQSATSCLPEAPSLPPLTRQHVDSCAFHSWHDRFRSVTFKSRVIGPLPKEFVDYLNADGVYLPLDSNGDPQPSHNTGTGSYSDNESEDTKSEATENEDSWLANIPSFPDLERRIAEAIEKLGGTVFPKLNWTAPRDAGWVALNNSLKCTSPADVFLLLKSSDFVAHDLGNPYQMSRDEGPPEHPSDGRPADELHLVLRKWIEVEPSMEFRCFVKDRELVGISQRDTFNFYPFLGSMKSELNILIQRLWKDVEPKFSETNFTFDVYVSNATGTRKALVMDFNPFAYYTDALLFEWDELATWNGPLGFRLIESEDHARGCARGWANPKFSSSRLPLDASMAGQRPALNEEEEDDD